MERALIDQSRRGFWRLALPAVAILPSLFGCSSSDESPAAKSGDASTAGSNGAGGNSGGASASGGNSQGAGGGSQGAGGGSQGAGGGSTTTGPVDAKTVAQKLGRSHFLIGLGNDLDPNYDHNKDGAYRLGVTMDLHYAYLSGGSFPWTQYNAGGTFVNILADPAKSHGTVPMFTLYVIAQCPEGEGSIAGLVDDAGCMKPYWDGAKLLYQRLAVFGDAAVVHLEPDFWAYAEQQSHGDPSAVPVHVTSLAPDCSSLTDDLAGMGKCLVALGRKYAPKALIGFHASSWADGDPKNIAAFLTKIGAGDADIVVTDMLDRDAGCFEAHTDPGCQRTSTGVYWDETNTTSPNFHEHLAWVKSIVQGIGRPMLWWQLPLGVPSDTPGGTPGHYRDNRVKYIFSHIDEFIAAGGMGVTFGVGAGNQTDWKTDNGQFKNAVTAYFQNPVRLP